MAYRNELRRYLIENGVPIAPLKKVAVYPFATMEVGDSFALEKGDWRELERIRAAVQNWQIRHAPMKFAVRQVDPVSKQYRCWRIK